MYICTTVSKQELDVLNELRKVSSEGKFEVLIDGMPLYVKDSIVAENIQREIDIIVSTVVFSIIDSSSNSTFKIDYSMIIDNEKDNGSYIQMKFQEDKRNPDYLRFYFNEKLEIIKVGYINKNDIQISYPIDENYLNVEEPTIGIFEIIKKFKKNSLRLSSKKRKPSKDSRVVNFGSHRIRVHKNESDELQRVINEIIKKVFENSASNVQVKSHNESYETGQRKVYLSLLASDSDECKFNTTIDKAYVYKRQSRTINFIVDEDTLELQRFYFDVADYDRTNYQDPMYNTLANFKKEESERVNSMKLIDGLNWILENKL